MFSLGSPPHDVMHGTYGERWFPFQDRLKKWQGERKMEIANTIINEWYRWSSNTTRPHGWSEESWETLNNLPIGKSIVIEGYHFEHSKGDHLMINGIVGGCWGGCRNGQKDLISHYIEYQKLFHVSQHQINVIINSARRMGNLIEPEPQPEPQPEPEPEPQPEPQPEIMIGGIKHSRVGDKLYVWSTGKHVGNWVGDTLKLNM
tara:strand:- start:74 stop:682 length:609 start_codon:yes stop_codon:yes gene_type:complete